MGIRINSNIVNQKGNPAWYEDTLAARPTANLQGRMFVDTNTPSSGIYRDTGSTWVQIADPGAGTTGTLQQVTTNGSTTNVGISITTLTPGSVLFSGTGGLISQDNTNLFWDDANNFLGIGPTGGPTALLDIHSATQNIFIQVNATSTNNSQVAFLNGGVGKWRIGNLYNAGANDFIIFDTTNTLSRLTIKNTGQTFIGTNTTSSGLFVVNSATSDNHYVAIGSNAPSYRLRDVGSGGALNCGIGISTAVNNFIQGSASGNFCFFNSSTTASPILFGVYDAGTGNTQEAIRISAARNLLVGSATDSGYKLDVNGTGRFTDNLSLTGSTAKIIGGDSVGRLVLANSTQTTYGIFYGATNATPNITTFINNSALTLTLNANNSATFYSALYTGGTIQITGQTTPPSGSGVEIFLGTSGTQGFIQAYNRTSSSWLDIKMAGANLYFNPNGTTALTLASTGVATFSSSIAIGNTLTTAIAAPSTHKVSILIGGVQYYLLASNI